MSNLKRRCHGHIHCNTELLRLDIEIGLPEIVRCVRALVQLRPLEVPLCWICGAVFCGATVQQLELASGPHTGERDGHKAYTA